MEKIFNFPDELYNSDYTNIFYGTGIRSRERLQMLIKNHIRIDYLGDSDSDKWGTYIDDILCISHEEIQKFEKVNLIIGSYIYREEIYQRMLKIGLSEEQIFYDNFCEEMNETLL